MTENEAIARMRYRIDTAMDIAGKGSDGKAYEDMEMAIKALEEIQKYQAIGTVKECQEARERQIEKKPLSRTYCKDGNYLISQNIGRCPSCNGIVTEDMLWCDDCGQKLDWFE